MTVEDGAGRSQPEIDMNILGCATAVIATFYAFTAVVLAVRMGWSLIFLILLVLGALEMALATKKIWRL